MCFAENRANIKTSNIISYGPRDGQSELLVKSREHFAEVTGRLRHYFWLLLVCAVESLLCC